MPDEVLKQKLTAILSADVKEYSRLMSQDRVGTIDSLKSHRVLFSDFIYKYGGHVIDNPGDEILAAFESVSDTVNCAVEIQRELAERNAEVPSARMMQWRIGISLGEVIEEEGRIYGDWVNITVRVQSLAVPGGICISGTVYDQVQDKLGLEFESLGEQEAKNIAEPIRIYRVLSYPGAAAHRVTKAKADLKKTWRNTALIVIAITAISVGSVLIWKYISPKEIPPTKAPTAEKTVAPAEKPSIAVLPFDNLSDDPDQEYFSDGISEDILDGLARNPGLIVKARTSSFKFKGQKEDIRKIGEMLGVTHVVEGSVRKSGTRIRVTAQLIEANSDSHIWSHKYDRQLTDAFDIQDDIAAAILDELNLHLQPDNRRNARTKSIEAHNAYLMGRYYHNRMMRDEAVDSLNKAISLDQNYTDAYSALALIQSDYVWSDQAFPEDKFPIVDDLIDKALSIEPWHSGAMAIRTNNLFFLERKYQKALDDYNRLLVKHPNDTELLQVYLNALLTLGLTDLAIAVANRMTELDPLNGWAYHSAFLAHMIDKDRKKALISSQKSEQFGYPVSWQRSALALAKRDRIGLSNELNRIASEYSHLEWLYPVAQAWVLIIDGDYTKAREIVSPLQSVERLSCWARWHIALAMGETKVAIEHYANGLERNETLCFMFAHGLPGYPETFPEFYAHALYHKMLKDVDLDKESIAKLKIPPLPF